MRYYIKSNKGFSLVELIITVSLIFVIVSLGYILISAGNSNFDSGTAKAHLQQNTRLLDEYIQKNLRNATNMNVTSNQEQQLDNLIFIEDNIAKTSDVNLTAEVIDDIQIRVNENGDRPIIEYIINASGDGETYELINSMVMNNLPPTYFAGAFSNFTSIGAAAISFNSDIILPPDRSLSSDPDELVRGTVYEGDDVIALNIYVDNDIFNEALGVLDATLGGSISSLSVIDIEKVNDTQITLTIGNGTVVDAIGEGTVTIRESAFQIGGDLSVVISIVHPEIIYIQVSGNNVLTIPDEGNVLQETYTMTAYDINDNPITNESAVWTLVSSYPGVSIGEESGVLTVTPSTEPGTITIQAQSERNTEIIDEFQIALEESTISLQDIMDLILTLPYSDGYDAYDRPSYVTVPEYEDVLFQFTGVTGYLDLVNTTKVKVKDKWNQVNTGTITLMGTMDGESLTKVFDVYIPTTKSGDPIIITPASS